MQKLQLNQNFKHWKDDCSVHGRKPKVLLVHKLLRMLQRSLAQLNSEFKKLCGSQWLKIVLMQKHVHEFKKKSCN